MSKHTPGPWIHRDRLTDKCGATNIGTADGYAICDMAYHYSSLGRDELDANARLIASAPELLEALRDLMKYVEYVAHAKGKVDPGLFQIGIDKAVAAIAKAEGE